MNEKLSHEEKIEELANKIKDLLIQNESALDTSIYFNDKCIVNGEKLIEGVKASEKVEYANDKTITMTFEGTFYYMLNIYGGGFIHEFIKLLEGYGYYYEQGFSWSLSLYKI